MEELIKTLDLRDYFSNGHKKYLFINALHDILMSTGFFFLKNHGIPEELVKEYGTVSMQFFNLPIETKAQYRYPHFNGQIGWTPRGVEKGEYAAIPDLKEFFMVGDLYPIPYIPELPEFSAPAAKLFMAFRNAYRAILRPVAESLCFPPDYFEDKEGNSSMRSIYYPADPNPPVDDEDVETAGGNALGMCSSRHTDIDLLTLLFARKPGLQLKYRGEYVPVTVPDPNLIIVNAGDMLEHLTGGKYVSGMHRVVCEPNIERWSVPFFGHVLPETSIVPIFLDADRKQYPYQLAGEFLEARIRKIGLAAM